VIKRLGTIVPYACPQEIITVAFSLDSCRPVGWDVETRPIEDPYQASTVMDAMESGPLDVGVSLGPGSQANG
jgi:hypothetical protein